MRTQTKRLMAMMDEGLISAEAVAEMALAYMSEDDVADMMRANDILEDDEDVEELFVLEALFHGFTTVRDVHTASEILLGST